MFEFYTAIKNWFGLTKDRDDIDCKVCGAPYCDLHPGGCGTDEEDESEVEDDDEEEDKCDEQDKNPWLRAWKHGRAPRILG